MNATVEKMAWKEVGEIAKIHESSFPRQRRSQEFIAAHFHAYPLTHIYVLKTSKVIGYIIWTHKSGFRKNVVLELVQVAINPQQRSQGHGKHIIEKSFEYMSDFVVSSGATVHAILVTTRSDNNASNLYQTTLGVREVGRIPGIFSADEQIFARIF